MKSLTQLKAERDTLQNTVNQINHLIATKDFTEDQIVIANRKKKTIIEELKKIREEINEQYRYQR